MLKTQISQVAQQQTSSSAFVGTFPRQPIQNPKGNMNIVTLRSGKELKGDGEKNNENKDSEKIQFVGKIVEKEQ